VASPNLYPAAFSSVGPTLATYVGNYFSGSVRWVSSTHTAASDANAGTEPELPKLTWTSAYDASSAGDIIIVDEDHTETVSAADTLATAGVMTIGLGSGSSRPRFTSAVAGAMWSLSADEQRFINLYFPASTAATTSRIDTSNASDSVIQGCYFECGTNDTTTTLLVRQETTVDGCSFVATASRPARAIRVSASADGVRIRDVLVDGSSYGWSAAAISIEAAVTNWYMENVRLANHSDVVLTTTASTYKLLGVRPMDNTGSRIVLAA
jgi:hypothetical protein